MAAIATVSEGLVSADPRTISERVAQHVAALEYDALPASVIDVSKKLMLDTLAVAWGGRDAPGAPESHALLTADGGKQESTIWGYGGKLPASGAAFLNSLFGAALDYDAVNNVHADVVALPAALAVAERQHASGKEFLTAYVLGADLACRLGGAITGPHKGWFTTSIYGVFGAAAAAARLLGLKPEAIAHSFGIALSQAAGTQQANVEQALTKRLQSAFAARAGVFSALLAARGVTAPRLALEGKFGLYQLYQEGNPLKVLDGLGRQFEQEKTNVKKYPTCACGHAALDAAFDLIRRYDLKPEDVTAVEVTHSPLMHRLVGAPFDPTTNPQVTGQFSVQYSIAAALLRRRVSVEDIQDAAVLDPKIKEIARRIAIVVDETSKATRAPATVAMETRKHGRIACTVDHFPWSEASPATEVDLDAKVDACLAYGPKPLAASRRKLLIDRVRNIESVQDMSSFFAGIL